MMCCSAQAGGSGCRFAPLRHAGVCLQQPRPKDRCRTPHQHICSAVVRQGEQCPRHRPQLRRLSAAAGHAASVFLHRCILFMCTILLQICSRALLMGSLMWRLWVAGRAVWPLPMRCWRPGVHEGLHPAVHSEHQALCSCIPCIRHCHHSLMCGAPFPYRCCAGPACVWPSLSDPQCGLEAPRWRCSPMVYG